jgi:hypothetical protein
MHAMHEYNPNTMQNAPVPPGGPPALLVKANVLSRRDHRPAPPLFGRLTHNGLPSFNRSTYATLMHSLRLDAARCGEMPARNLQPA